MEYENKSNTAAPSPTERCNTSKESANYSADRKNYPADSANYPADSANYSADRKNYPADSNDGPGSPLPLTKSGEKSAADKERKFDERYLRMADIWSENSYCTRRKVGALIVKEKMIISDGFNGTPSGFENVCEDESGLTKPYVLHAEANAITKIARSGNNSDGATLYVTASPCIECAKLIIQCGIKRVVYGEHYRLTDGIDLLRRAGIQVDYIDKTKL